MDAALNWRLILNFSPEWNESKEFEVHLPELAMLEIIVLDHDHHGKDDKIGFNYVPDRLKNKNCPDHNKNIQILSTPKPADLNIALLPRCRKEFVSPRKFL